MAEAKLVNVKIFGIFFFFFNVPEKKKGIHDNVMGIFFFFFILQIKKFRNILWVSIDPQI